jgi:hypothetical protein
MSMFVITHKEFKKPDIKGYKILGVGLKNDLSNFADYRDCSGEDNIAEKNPSFCELTGMYWLWKHMVSDSYIGISHYRRYFSDSVSDQKYLSDERIRKILESCDVILPIHIDYETTIREQYAMTSGKESDLEILKEILEEQCPEYISSYEEVLNGKSLHVYNMLVMKQEDYAKYCAWLFPILFEAEKRIDVSDRDAYQKRIYGFLSERLLNVYVKHNSMKIYEAGVINTEDKLSSQVKVKTAVKRVLYRLKQGI